jgi:membrane protease subunit HflK
MPGGNGPTGGGPRPPPGRGPWSQGPAPDVDQIIARLQAWARRLLPGGAPGGRGFILLGVGVVAIWLASGFYRVEPDEQGVVLRFGAFVRTTPPGLNYHLPWPIEAVDLPAVTRINRVEVGYRSNTQDRQPQPGQDVAATDVPAESLMLTGDENIIDINFTVFWRISDGPAFLFNTRNPAITVKSAAESVMREVIGSTPIQPALAEARAQIEAAVMKGTQAILDQYRTGVEITQVQLLKSNPPAEVIDSFRDVQRATTDAERLRNEAESYRNDIVPRARGDAARITAAADADRQAGIAKSTGESQRFLSVLSAYDAAKEVTLQRLYIETMQQILAHTPVTVVDGSVRNLIPYLPLGDTPGPGTAPPQAPPPPPGAAGAAAQAGFMAPGSVSSGSVSSGTTGSPGVTQ